MVLEGGRARADEHGLNPINRNIAVLRFGFNPNGGLRQAGIMLPHDPQVAPNPYRVGCRHYDRSILVCELPSERCQGNAGLRLAALT